MSERQRARGAAAAAHMTVSSAPLTNWPASAGKASIESYGAPTSSANARRFIMESRQVDTLPSPGAAPEALPVAKNLQLPPATYPEHEMSRITRTFFGFVTTLLKWPV